ncbi:hypothetical protein HYN59_09550 [Flavobacterium album]|uniref:Histidine kinase/HSP90-like ATPase domain-containing protein n=1 Tax=Flavobacterium album TaxID=2175091 RepID=A0A2S1R2R9_9FLAO|nr:hypothetical protein HYN59_09550 [Flavobacterium album]
MEIYISENSISIKNTGDEKALDSNYIFKRFTRNSASEQSTGLGLSIVNSIIANYRLNVNYTFDGSHIFTITFPK